jgi:hypothetical protein
MTYANPLSSLIETELLATELWRAGQYLDAVDTGRIPVDAGRYQRAARKARLLLESCGDTERKAAICSMSPALQELGGEL